VVESCAPEGGYVIPLGINHQHVRTVHSTSKLEKIVFKTLSTSIRISHSLPIPRHTAAHPCQCYPSITQPNPTQSPNPSIPPISNSPPRHTDISRRTPTNHPPSPQPPQLKNRYCASAGLRCDQKNPSRPDRDDTCRHQRYRIVDAAKVGRATSRQAQNQRAKNTDFFFSHTVNQS
jgi:hypothetical protein